MPDEPSPDAPMKDTDVAAKQPDPAPTAVALAAEPSAMPAAQAEPPVAPPTPPAPPAPAFGDVLGAASQAFRDARGVVAAAREANKNANDRVAMLRESLNSATGQVALTNTEVVDSEAAAKDAARSLRRILDEYIGE